MQTHNPSAPGYRDPSSVYGPEMDRYEAQRQLGLSRENSDYANRINSLKSVFGLTDGSGGGGFLGGSGGSGGSGGALPPNTDIPVSMPMMTRVPGVNAPDMTQANAQIFGRAKDQAGQVGRASLQSLRDELGATGMLGSGAEAQGTRDIAARGAGLLGEVSRENAVNESAQKADFAKMKYQGDITQRGQDIAAQDAAARLALERELAKQRMLLEALRGLTGGAGGGGGGSSLPSGGGGGAAPPRGGRGGGGGVVVRY